MESVLEAADLPAVQLIEAPSIAQVADSMVQEASEAESQSFPFIWVGVAVGAVCALCALVAGRLFFGRKLSIDASPTFDSTTMPSYRHARANPVFHTKPSEPDPNFLDKKNACLHDDDASDCVQVNRLAPNDLLPNVPLDTVDQEAGSSQSYRAQLRIHQIAQEPMADSGISARVLVPSAPQIDQLDFSRDSKVHKDGSMECVICFESVRSRVFRPCGHVCACEKCSDHLMTLSNALCPMCRQPVTESLKIYL